MAAGRIRRAARLRGSDGPDIPRSRPDGRSSAKSRTTRRRSLKKLEYGDRSGEQGGVGRDNGEYGGKQTVRERASKTAIPALRSAFVANSPRSVSTARQTTDAIASAKRSPNSASRSALAAAGVSNTALLMPFVRSWNAEQSCRAIGATIVARRRWRVKRRPVLLSPASWPTRERGRSAAASCGPSGAGTPGRNGSSAGCCTASATATDSTGGTSPAARTWCFQRAARRFSCMAASGMRMIAAGVGRRNPGPITGSRNLNGTGRATPKSASFSRPSAGGSGSSGSAKLATLAPSPPISARFWTVGTNHDL